MLPQQACGHLYTLSLWSLLLNVSALPQLLVLHLPTVALCHLLLTLWVLKSSLLPLMRPSHMLTHALDLAALLRMRHPRFKTQAWVNESVRTVRKECRKAARSRRKDKLQVLLGISGNGRMCRGSIFSRLELLFDTIHFSPNPRKSP